MRDWRVMGTRTMKLNGLLLKLVKFVPEYNAAPKYEVYVDLKGHESFVGYAKEVVWNAAK